MRKLQIKTPGADTFFVRIDSQSDGVMKGVVDGISMPEQYEFNDLAGLVLMLDSHIDQQEEALQPLIKQLDASFKPTFELEILFRQNHSWQGRVRWQGGQKEATFKSVLELLVIIETVFGE